MKRILPFFLFLFQSQQMLHAQVKINSNLGGSVGLVLALGTHIDRMGICLKAFYTQDQFQLNADLRFYENIRNLGPKGFYPEGFASLGIVYGYGKKDTLDINPFLSQVSNQTRRSSSIGYAYNIYFNEIGTTQPTGMISLQFGRVNLIGEDDLFAHPGNDRFRTGAVLLQYNYNNQFQFGANTTLWTGQMGKRIKGTSYPHAIGYLDTTGGSYCNYSHGMLSLQVKTMLPFYNQTEQGFQGREGQISAGVDADQIRNVIQNRFFHDMIFLPEKWRNTQNADMPMLDEQGEQYLYLPGQKIRRPELYLNGYLNPEVFY